MKKKKEKYSRDHHCHDWSVIHKCGDKGNEKHEASLSNPYLLILWFSVRYVKVIFSKKRAKEEGEEEINFKREYPVRTSKSIFGQSLKNLINLYSLSDNKKDANDNQAIIGKAF